MLDVQTAMLANQAMNYLLTGTAPRRHGNGHPNIMPQQVFCCADGPIVLAVGNDGQFERLCKMLGRADLAADPRLMKNAGRVERRGMLTRVAHPTAGTVPLVGSPMRFAEQPAEPPRSPPLLGEHTAEILGELGFLPAEIDGLRAAGVI